MARENLLPLPDILKEPPPRLSCSGCADGKRRPKPYHPTTHRYDVALSISSDSYGPITPTSIHGNKYLVLFVDTKSRYILAYFTATRRDMLKFTTATIAYIRNLKGETPRIFTTDNAREYLSKAAQKVYDCYGIQLRPTIPYTPQRNSIVERLNGTLHSAARATLFHANLPPVFWEDAVRDAVFMYNITRHSVAQQLPFTDWFGSAPSITRLFAFGQLGTATVKTDPAKVRKLDPRSYPARYMYAVDLQDIVVRNMRTQQYLRVRATDFQPYTPLHDPLHTTRTAFKCHLPHPDPEAIDAATPAPK